MVLTKKQPKPTHQPRNPADPDARYIKLGNGKYAIVDAADYIYLQRFRWFPKRSRNREYAVRRIRRAGRDTLVRMHREITNCPRGMIPHHRDSNTMNNRQRNLLVCTPEVHRQIHKEIQNIT